MCWIKGKSNQTGGPLQHLGLENILRNNHEISSSRCWTPWYQGWDTQINGNFASVWRIEANHGHCKTKNSSPWRRVSPSRLLKYVRIGGAATTVHLCKRIWFMACNSCGSSGKCFSEMLKTQRETRQLDDLEVGCWLLCFLYICQTVLIYMPVWLCSAQPLVAVSPPKKYLKNPKKF
jgi:hypothetical protein